MSMLAMWSNPVWLMAPVSGSQIACHVNWTSFVVSGCPSDQFRPFLSLIVTSMCVESIVLTSPFLVVGISVTRSGRKVLVASSSQRPA